MKAVFPCKGVVVLTKKDIQILEAFYRSTLTNSKMFEIYNTTEYMVQIGNFNYLPPKASLVVNEISLLTTSKLRSVMNGTTVSQKASNDSQDADTALSDDDILSHPFFKTLKPID